MARTNHRTQHARPLRVVAAWLVVIVCGFSFTAQAAPPVINSISPNSVVQNPVPQPTFTISGSGFVVGFPTSTNRPTVTFVHEGGKTEFGGICNVNIAGTTITIPGTDNNFNLLQAPVGMYDVVVTRPDGQSGTLADGFTINPEPVPTGIHIKQVGTWGGPIRDVDVVGDLAYITNGRAMRILNISNPADPVEIGSIDLLSVDKVRVRDGYAFIAAEWPYFFCVVDVHDPTQPRLVWHSQSISVFEDLQLHGNVAYIKNGTQINGFDIGDPLNVVLLSTVIGTGVQSVGKFTIAGDRLYVGCNSGGGTVPQLQIYDLAANPVNPPLMGAVPADIGAQPIYYTRGIAVEGNYAAWTVSSDNFEKLFIVDVSNPAAPVIVGSYSDFNSVNEVVMSNGFVYVGDGAGDIRNNLWALCKGMAVFNVSNPANPVLVTNYKPHGSVMGLRIIGNRAYLRDEGEGLIIMDVSNPANPVRLGNYHSPSTLRKAVKAPGSDLLYIADAWNGFTVLNVADPLDPDVVGVHLSDHFNDLNLNVFGIALQNNRVYLGAGHVGMEVVDVSNPAAPAFLGAFRVPPLFPPQIDTSAFFNATAVTDNIAHVGFSHPCGLSSINFMLNLDVSNPQNISEVGRVALTGCGTVGAGNSPTSIAIDAQGYAFISRAASPNDNYVTVDTSQAGNPQLIYTSDITSIIDVALDGDVLYIANNAGFEEPGEGLHIQDVSDPGNPTQLAYVCEVPDSHQVYAVAVQHKRAYVSAKQAENGGYEHLTLYDVSDPSSPVLLARSPRAIAHSHSIYPTQSNAVVVDEPYIYRAYGDPSHNNIASRPSAGLAIYRVENLPAPPCPADVTGDQNVNILDILAIIGAWGQTGKNIPADINNDNIVNILDLLAAIGSWGPCQ